MGDSTADTREDAVRIRGVQCSGPRSGTVYEVHLPAHETPVWTVVLGTYDFKTQRPTISLVSLDSGQALRTFERSSTTRGIRGNPASAPTAKVSSILSVKREWTNCGCNRSTAAPADS
jgi:hypothetical protein